MELEKLVLMLFIKYETWCECVKGLYDRQPQSLQTYPFIKNDDTTWLLDKSFFEQQIKSGKVFLNPYTWLVEDSIMLFKEDGHSRLNTTLISPMLLLIYTAVAKELSNLYPEPPRKEYYYPFYGGDFKKNEFKYYNAYDQYRKILLENKAKYAHYKFLDFFNFYPSINLPHLLQKIEARIDSNELSLKDKLFIARLLEYLGKGYFPTIDNSVASAYLATMIYLEEFDKNLYSYLETNKKIKDFLLVRYIDDCYILVNFTESANAHDEDEQLNFKIQEWIPPLRLAANTKKITSFCNTEDLDERLSLGSYDYINHKPKSPFPQAVKLEMWGEFLEQVVQQQSMSFDTYNEIVAGIYWKLKPKYPSLKKHKDIFRQVFDADEKVVLHKDYIEKFKEILKEHWGVLKYSGPHLVRLILATKDETLIKILLNQIFQEHRREPSIWNTRLSVFYLLDRNFSNGDLMKDIKTNTSMIPAFATYIEHFCCTNFSQYYTNLIHTPVLSFVQNSLPSNNKTKPEKTLAKSIYLYFLYKCEYSPANYLQRYAFYKNYFDGITAVISGTSVENCYQEKQLKGIYEPINGSDVVITAAYKLRNGNPLAHASSTLLDIHTAPSDIDKIICNLDELIRQLSQSKQNSTR
jgi:AbiA family abortive infection protein